ncbi:hypothetical protein GEV33_005063 [Tenebrio molitor]|uniref:Uncharacterized protein n=1 Tax=Tenebrio molitor TaxID=7067 RepID=A0A8J6HQC2_TENMO|nr:hypothetical protein GEV33_005063 [Tenebrio molitor]
MWNIRIYLVRQVSCKPWELSTADVARCPPALDALSTPLDVMRSLQYSPFENATASNHEVDNKLSQAIAAGIQFAPNSLRIPPSNGIQLPFLSESSPAEYRFGDFRSGDVDVRECTPADRFPVEAVESSTTIAYSSTTTNSFIFALYRNLVRWDKLGLFLGWLSERLTLGDKWASAVDIQFVITSVKFLAINRVSRLNEANHASEFDGDHAFELRKRQSRLLSWVEIPLGYMAGADPKWQKDAADQNFDYMFKLLIIGNSSVGKTSFLFRYADDSFTSAFVSTVGIDFKVKTVFRHDKRVKLQIWDTAGQERYRTITTAYYRGAMGFILMYDITNEESFNSVQDW